MPSFGMECAYCFLGVKLQLTKTKTIEINFPGGGRSKSAVDITGIEMFSPDCQGCPAVRIVNRKKAWHLVAADVVKDPNGELLGRTATFLKTLKTFTTP